MNLRKSVIGQLLTAQSLRTAVICGIIVQIIWVGMFYGTRLLSLNQYLFTIEGDGLKSYFNVVYQAKHATQATKLQGMSYPFGESVFLEDSMPWLNMALHQSSRIFPAISNYIVGIINLLYFVSLLVAMLFLVFIFHYYGISGVASGLVSNGIVMLSSMHLLLWPFGHIGLSHPAFLPMGIYFLLRFFNSGGAFKWSVVLMLNTIFWSFIHVYLGLILLFLGIGTHLVYLMFCSQFYKGWSKGLGDFLLQIGIPLFMFILFLKLLDTHPDRIDLPFIEDHRSTLSTILLPAESPLRNWFLSITGFQPDTAFRWQRIGSYLGIGTLTAFAVMISTIFFRKRETWHYFSKQQHFELLALWISGWLLLLYSMAFPFRFLPEEWLNQIPYLKQFSSFGRFAWAFYFVSAVFSMVWIHRKLKEKIRTKIIFIAGLAFLLESVPIHSKISSQGLNYSNPFTNRNTNSDYSIFQQVSTKHYQAIIPLPTYFKYAIPIDKPGSDSVIFASMVAAVQTGVPVMSTFLSRPSVTESLKIYRAIQSPPYRVPLTPCLNDQRDFALIHHVSDTAWFDTNEKKLIAQAQIVARNSRFCIYRLSKDSLLNNRTDTIVADYPSDTFFTQPRDAKFFWESWNESYSPVWYRGEGAFYGKKASWNTLAKIPASNLDRVDEFCLSFWYYNHQWDQTFNTLFLSETNPQGETIQWINLFANRSERIDDWWYFFEQRFRVHSPDNTISILSLGQNKFLPWFAVDELLIRPVGVDVFKVVEKDGYRFLLKNNLLFKVIGVSK